MDSAELRDRAIQLQGAVRDDPRARPEPLIECAKLALLEALVDRLERIDERLGHLYRFAVEGTLRIDDGRP